jgi:hypothetical protein
VAAAAQRQRRKFNADASHNILRPISLLQAMNADNLSETVQIAFGDAPVREGSSREFGDACELARRERTTQQLTKAIERTRAVTRTANGRVKARSGGCKCVDCCCCCFCSSWGPRAAVDDKQYYRAGKG